MQEKSSTPLQLSDLHLPDVPSWLPLAWGWWASIGAIVVVIIIVLLVVRWKRKRLAPKKTALRLLTPSLGLQTPSSAIELLRQAAFCYYPREQIAHLTGKDWYAFLDDQVGRPLFVPHETQWQQALYQKQSTVDSNVLIEDCYQWINDALPPKKRRSVNVGKH
ncbi:MULTISPECIES: DUF4381 domain-containing protein [Vibrio]|uniref:DUF4381 family protein n=2 Tax=Vibrio TaxID=662 RepID=A0A7X4LLY3_9VIBR|nr:MULTISPECIES: DUF4381 domain-containing protein [Vibrio]MBF9002053.1 DUF4381 domain-containing protein [Vibrio nitrifigilis]MZI94006.1 DUF4381 family protein [Vibrio eleionomae]